MHPTLTPTSDVTTPYIGKGQGQRMRRIAAQMVSSSQAPNVPPPWPPSLRVRLQRDAAQVVVQDAAHNVRPYQSLTYP